MPLRFSIGIGSLGEEILILLKGLENFLKPKREKNFRYFERDRRIKSQNYSIEIWVRMTDRVFRLLEFIQGFINDRRVVDPSENKGFYVIKFIQEIRRIKANM